jgi:hypothetical protein
LEALDVKRKIGLKREIPEEHSWVLQQLSSNALTLAGFSFTSLVFMIGFLGKLLSPSVTSSLLLCTITFTIAGEMARTSYSLEEYIVSEALYFFSLVLLFYSFITLTYESLRSFGVVPIVAAIVGLLYVIWRTFANFRLLRTSRRPAS